MYDGCVLRNQRYDHKNKDIIIYQILMHGIFLPKTNFNIQNTAEIKAEMTWSKNIIILHNTSIPRCISI